MGSIIRRYAGLDTHSKQVARKQAPVQSRPDDLSLLAPGHGQIVAKSRGPDNYLHDAREPIRRNPGVYCLLEHVPDGKGMSHLGDQEDLVMPAGDRLGNLATSEIISKLS